jgi:glycine amidinotransferase
MDALPEVLKQRDLLVAPPEAPTSAQAQGLLSEWIHLNVLVLDSERIIVEALQAPLVRALKDWGFKPIPSPFMDCCPFVGSFHCATLDVRRRRTLQSCR